MEKIEFPKWIYKGLESQIVNSKEEIPKGWHECPMEAQKKPQKKSN